MRKRSDGSLVVWLVIFAILFAAGVIKCQTPNKEPLHSTKHPNRIQQEDEIRFMSVTVTEKNSNLVYLYRENKKLIEVTYLFWDDQSVYKDINAKPPYTFKGCFLMAYCLQHKYIYWLQREACVDSDSSFFFKDGKGG